VLLKGLGNGLAHLGHVRRVECLVELFTSTCLYVVFDSLCYMFFESTLMSTAL
jgi:hypothetical protein